MKTKTKKNNEWIGFFWFFGILFILGSCIGLMEGSPKPTPASPVYSTSAPSISRYAAESTAQVQLTQDAQDAQILIWESQATQAASSSCPNGCATHINGCDIKGNIGFDSGAKIYHLPGQKFYASTDINPAYGERWFCTEAEATANGWRKSYQ